MASMAIAYNYRKAQGSASDDQSPAWPELGAPPYPAALFLISYSSYCSSYSYLSLLFVIVARTLISYPPLLKFRSDL